MTVHANHSKEVWDVEPLQLSQLWTPAGILADFLVAALSWRIRRELDMEAQGEVTWLTLADALAGCGRMDFTGSKRLV